MLKPISTITISDVIIEYEMSDEYKLYEFSNEELIYFFKGKKLEFFTSQEIIYGDINTRNILFNRSTGDIKFCDVDNIEINNCRIDKLPFSLIEYNKMRGI